MNVEIGLMRVEAVFTAVVRGRARLEELPQFVPAACGEAWAYIRSAGLANPGRNVALYEGLPEGGFSVEAGAEVSEIFEGNDRVVCSRLPAGRVAHTVFFGPYAGLGRAHLAVQDWCAAQGHGITGVAWEVYGHWEEVWNAQPDKIRTDVFYLLRGESENDPPEFR